jgi:hypothetical protein
MRRLLLALSSSLFLSMAAPQAHAQAPLDAQALLAASDAIRNPAKSFALTATLVEYRGGKQMLKNGTDLWFYDPANQATIRISPDQRLLGQAANGDVATANLAHDYKATAEGEEDLTDGERQTRHCRKLALASAAAGLTYHHIELWLDARNSQPVKAKFYSESDRLLKTAFYRKFRDELGTGRPTETVIIDGLDPAWVTVLTFSDYAWRDLPEAWLQREYLPRFNSE